MQADYDVLDAFIPNSSAHSADRAVVFSDADIHDLQRLAVLRRRTGSCHRLLPVWLEKIRHCRCHGTLPLAFNNLL